MKILITVFILGFGIISQAQKTSKDVKSIEGITNLLLDILSGPQGEKRDWELYKSLFTEGATMHIVNLNAPIGKQMRTIPVDEFVETYSAAYSRDGFLEESTGLVVNEFKGVANAFQSFYCKNLIGTYENRGINTYQLVFADDRWWITNIAFANETEDSKVPEKYLEVEKK